MADTTPKMALKLFIHKEKRKVVFAEARKDFVDFLFNLLTLPLGTVTQIVTKNLMVGGIGNIYKSADALKESYFFLDKQTKEILIKPSTPDMTTYMITPLKVPDQNSKKFYWCGRNTHRNRICISEHPRAICNAPYNEFGLACGGIMSCEVSFVSSQPESGKRGYVKDEVAYMVTDDLSVEPLSTTSIVTLLSLNDIKHMGILEEKVVYLDMDKGLKLLNASLQSKEVLTSVFL